jgi:NAD+ synthase
LEIDPQRVKERIISSIKQIVKERDVNGCLVIFSGQNDSYTTTNLCIEALGREFVKIFIVSDISAERRNQIVSEAKKHLSLSEESQIITINFQKIMKQFDSIEGLIPGETGFPFIRKRQHELGHMLLRTQLAHKLVEEKTFTHVGKTKSEQDDFFRKVLAYSKVRKRLMILLAYFLAERENLLLVSKTNKSEFLTGLVTTFGYGHGGDIAPIGDLYRTQVLEMADYLDVPQHIRSLAYSDVMPGVNNKYKYFFELESRTVDEILVRLDAGLLPFQIAKVLDLQLDLVERVNHFFQAAKFQKTVPFIPKID